MVSAPGGCQGGGGQAVHAGEGCGCAGGDGAGFGGEGGEIGMKLALSHRGMVMISYEI